MHLYLIYLDKTCKMTKDTIIRLIKRFLAIAAVIFSGSAIRSLLICDSETWRVSVTIVLTCLSYWAFLSRD